MKTNTTTLILGVALAVVAGLFSSTIFGLTGTNVAKSSVDTATSGYITGHVLTTVTDPAGNIKEYRQSDNLIVNQGENCVVKMLFGASGGDSVGDGTNTCTGEINSGFTVIAVGNSSIAAGNANVTLNSEHSAASGVASLARKAGSVSITNSTAASGVSQASAVIQATFTNSAGATYTVTESGLFNSTSTSADGMFARQVFTAVTLNNGDSLTVEWTVNIGGTSTINQSGG